MSFSAWPCSPPLPFEGPHGFPKVDVSIRSGRKMPSSAAWPISSLSCGNIPNTKNRWGGGRVARPIPPAGSKFLQGKGKVGGGSRKGYRIIARATRGKANASFIPMNPAIQSRQGLPLMAAALSQCAINFWLLHLVCQLSIIHIHQSWSEAGAGPGRGWGCRYPVPRNKQHPAAGGIIQVSPELRRHVTPREAGAGLYYVPGSSQK